MRFAGESNPRFFPICAPARLAIPYIKKEARRQMALLHNRILAFLGISGDCFLFSTPNIQPAALQ